MEAEKAALFNSYVTDWKNRIETLIKSVMLLSGSVMSITIGAYINAKQPNISLESLSIIKISWHLLSASLVCSILTFYLIVVSQAVVISSWKSRVRVNDDGLILIDSPKWVRASTWALGTISVLLCVIGLIMVAYGASSILIAQKP